MSAAQNRIDQENQIDLLGNAACLWEAFLDFTNQPDHPAHAGATAYRSKNGMADYDEPCEPTHSLSPSPIYLVACVAAKLDGPAPARDLYISHWFKKARAYVERQAGTWFILSAEYGLIEPYDQSLNRMSAGARRLWGPRVLETMGEQIEAKVPLIILAGRD